MVLIFSQNTLAGNILKKSWICPWDYTRADKALNVDGVIRLICSVLVHDRTSL